jgi:predicted DNA-binding transcriptional regulator AlpA
MSKYHVSNALADHEQAYLNEVELAEWLNISRRTLQGWRLRGGGPAYEKFGRSVRYGISKVRAWIAERERTSTSAQSSDGRCNILGNGDWPDFLSGDRS